MKNLWNISLFKVSLLIIISLFINNVILFFLISIYLLIIKKYKELIIYIIVIILSLFISSINISLLKIGIVDNKTSDDTCIVDNIIYRTKLNNCGELNTGDVVLFEGKLTKNEDLNSLKKHIIFKTDDNINKIYTIKIRSLINKRINSFNDETKGYLKTILLNEYNELDTSISFGFCFYYLFLFLLRKNKLVAYISLFIYILFFGFEIKLILIYLTLLVNIFNISKINKLCLKILFILIINKYLLLNYSILITLLISFIYTLDKNQKFYIMIMQSILFNYINPAMSFLYKYIITSRVVAFILALFTIIIKPFECIFLYYIKVLSFILNLLTIEIRGRLSIISMIFLLLIFLIIRLKNEYLKILILIFLLITPINNPFAKIVFIDVGQGDSILIKDKLCTGNILIDTGSEFNYYKLKRYLYSQGVYKIDKLIITHNDSDHSGNIENLNKDFKINEIITIPKDIVFNKVKFISLNNGGYDNDNDNSLVYYLNYYGLNYLFTGDISKQIEKSIISKYPINVDVLKVGHHGSKNSSSEYFISNLLPKFAIISTSGMYSHPHKEVTDILNRYNISTLITKNQGDIEFIYTNLFTLIKTSSNDFVIIR